MQAFIVFYAESVSLPMAYNQLVHGLIYNAMRLESGVSAQLHDMPPLGGRQFKGFTFSRMQGAYRVEGGRIVFSGPVRLEVRSVFPDFIGILAHSLTAHPYQRIGGAPVEVVDCRIRDRRIETDCVSIRMASPAVAYERLADGSTSFYAPDEARFYQALARNAAMKYMLFYGCEEAPPLTVTPLFAGLPKKLMTSFKQTYITGWFGRYALRCDDPLMLDLLYQTGLGVKNAEGFGMFDVV